MNDDDDDGNVWLACFIPCLLLLLYIATASEAAPFATDHNSFVGSLKAPSVSGLSKALMLSFRRGLLSVTHPVLCMIHKDMKNYMLTMTAFACGGFFLSTLPPTQQTCIVICNIIIIII